MAKPVRRKLKVSELEVYAPGQRKFMPNWSKRIANSFDSNALGVLVVSSRGNHNYVVDGQHRLEALRLLGKDTMVECLVYQDLTKEQEAALFVKLNHSKLVTAIDKFNVSLTAKDEEAVAINKICEANGVTVAGGRNDANYTGAVAVLAKIYSGRIVKIETEIDGPNLLKQTLACLRAAWGNEDNAFHGTVMSGLAAFLARHGGEIDFARLVRLMKKYSGGSAGLIRSARSLKDIRRVPIIPATASIFVDMYNTGLRNGNALPDWKR